MYSRGKYVKALMIMALICAPSLTFAASLASQTIWDTTQPPTGGVFPSNYTYLSFTAQTTGTAAYMVLGLHEATPCFSEISLRTGGFVSESYMTEVSNPDASSTLYAFTTPFTMVAGNEYALFGGNGCWNFQTDMLINSAGNADSSFGNTSVAAWLSGSSFLPGPPNPTFNVCDTSSCLIAYNSSSDTRTRIIDTNPANGETVATSSAVLVGNHGYINSDDFRSGAQVCQSFKNNGYNSSALVDVGFLGVPTAVVPAISFNKCWDIGSAGDFSRSTTTPIYQIGAYTMTTKISRPTVDFFFFTLGTTVLYSTTTTFLVSTTTGFDRLQIGAVNQIRRLASAADADGCSINFFATTSFSLSGCFLFLFAPDSNSFDVGVGGIFSSISERAPWGYLTRFAVIMADQATSTLPTYSVSVIEGPGATTTLTYNMDDTITGGGALIDSIRDPIYGKNDRDVIEPFVDLGLALAVIFFIVDDLVGMRRANGSGGDSREKTKMS